MLNNNIKDQQLSFVYCKADVKIKLITVIPLCECLICYEALINKKANEIIYIPKKFNKKNFNVFKFKTLHWQLIIKHEYTVFLGI